MTHELEIDLTHGQAGIKSCDHCAFCEKYIEKTEDSVCIGVDYSYEWVHLDCFLKHIQPVLEKARKLGKFKQVFTFR